MKLSSPAVFFGSVFVAVGLSYLLEAMGFWSPRPGIVLPVVLIVGGLALAVSGLGGVRRQP